MNRFQNAVVSEAIDDPEPLSEWELNFVYDLAERDAKAEGKYELSEKQNEIVNRISQKYL